jgi:hypothetical protein
MRQSCYVIVKVVIVQQVCDLPADRQNVAPVHTMKAYEEVEV